MTKLLVTGGAGFIGSEFVRQVVTQNHNVVVIDKLTYAGDMERLKEIDGKFSFYPTDIINKEFVDYIFGRERPDIVVHFAAETHVDRSILDATPFIDANVRGTQVLLDMARKYDINKFINIATDEVYGELGEEGEFYENTSLVPNSPYSVTKASADMLGRAYYRTFGTPVVTVRPSNNYGPWQYPEKLIPVVILKALNDEPIPVYGKGENIREWLFVSDCVKGIFNIIERGKPGQIYNLGSREEKRNIDVVKTILSLLSKPESLITFVKDRPGHDFRYALNTDKIIKEIGWTPQISFEEGIEFTVKWYVEHIEWAKQKLIYLKEYWNKVYKAKENK